MKIEINTAYNLPTKAHENDFLKQAKRQGFKWFGNSKVTNEHHWNSSEYCIKVEADILYHGFKEQIQKSLPNEPIIEWKIGFTKSDMQVGQAFKTREGIIYQWERGDFERYTEDLRWSRGVASKVYSNDIVEVYPMKITPLWKRKELKDAVKSK